MVFIAVAVTNTGNGTDCFGFAPASASGWPVAVYLDGNADNLHQPDETTVLARTGSLPMGGQSACFVGVTIPGGASGEDIVTLTATSAFDPACTATAA